MPNVNIPIPSGDHQLQCALRAMGCTLRVLGDGSQAIEWPLQGWTSWKDDTVHLPMERVRQVIEGRKLSSLQELHRSLLQDRTVVFKHPDWAAVRAAIEQASGTEV
jgi:hypothetical protein